MRASLVLALLLAACTDSAPPATTSSVTGHWSGMEVTDSPQCDPYDYEWNITISQDANGTISGAGTVAGSPVTISGAVAMPSLSLTGSGTNSFTVNFMGVVSGASASGTATQFAVDCTNMLTLWRQ